MEGYIYIIQSERNGRYYIGSTKNLEGRFRHHNFGDVKSTRDLRPWQLRFYQRFRNLTEARKIELKLKRLARRDILEKIIRDGKITMTA